MKPTRLFKTSLSLSAVFLILFTSCQKDMTTVASSVSDGKVANALTSLQNSFTAADSTGLWYGSYAGYVYNLAQKIPSYGRLAAFDFSSSLVKCGFNVEEPQSMYAELSTGPLNAIGLLLRLTNRSTSSTEILRLCFNLMKWFQENTDIFMVGQVLEDAICNWQKNTTQYILYQG